MKKFILLVCISLSILFIVDRAIGSLLEFYYFKAKSGVISRTNYAINETNEDLLIFGTSRANHHYNTKILEDSLSLSVYNTGRDGHMIFYQTAVLKSVLERYKPKQIVLDFTGTFEFRQNDYDRISTLLPYYNSNPEIRDLLLLKSKSERVKVSLSKIYRFNSKIITIISSNLEFNSQRANEKKSYKGYVPLFGEYKIPKESVSEKKNSTLFKVDKNKLEVFNEFIDLCEKNDIPLKIINSPFFYRRSNDHSIEMIKKICLEKNIEFLDFSLDTSFVGKKKLFKDESHLNNIGAERFTNELIKYLKKE